jgi:EAL domain-containing protein (putative c-di-GMP-specific phosphodiesterase class I)
MEYAATKSGLIESSAQLIFEITERGLPDSMGVEALNNLWGMKVRVALDDVTLAGGANLAVLARCHFGTIKLDRCLVSQIVPGGEYPAWLRGVAALLKSSQMMVIAEGVETKHQALTLEAAGIQAAQGFYFSPSISANAFAAFHAQRNGALLR